MDQSIDFKARALGSCTYGASWVVNSQLNAALIPNFCIFDRVNPVRTDYCDQARYVVTVVSFGYVFLHQRAAEEDLMYVYVCTTTMTMDSVSQVNNNT